MKNGDTFYTYDIHTFMVVKMACSEALEEGIYGVEIYGSKTYSHNYLPYTMVFQTPEEALKAMKEKFCEFGEISKKDIDRKVQSKMMKANEYYKKHYKNKEETE